MYYDIASKEIEGTLRIVLPSGEQHEPDHKSQAKWLTEIDNIQNIMTPDFMSNIAHAMTKEAPAAVQNSLKSLGKVCEISKNRKEKWYDFTKASCYVSQDYGLSFGASSWMEVAFTYKRKVKELKMRFKFVFKYAATVRSS